MYYQQISNHNYTHSLPLSLSTSHFRYLFKTDMARVAVRMFLSCQTTLYLTCPYHLSYMSQHHISYMSIPSLICVLTICKYDPIISHLYINLKLVDISLMLIDIHQVNWSFSNRHDHTKDSSVL